MKRKMLWLVGIVSAISAFVGVSLAVYKYFEKNGTCSFLKSFGKKDECQVCGGADDSRYMEEIPLDE